MRRQCRRWYSSRKQRVPYPPPSTGRRQSPPGRRSTQSSSTQSFGRTMAGHTHAAPQQWLGIPTQHRSNRRVFYQHGHLGPPPRTPSTKMPTQSSHTLRPYLGGLPVLVNDPIPHCQCAFHFAIIWADGWGRVWLLGQSMRVGAEYEGCPPGTRRREGVRHVDGRDGGSDGGSNSGCCSGDNRTSFGRLVLTFVRVCVCGRMCMRVCVCKWGCACEPVHACACACKPVESCATPVPPGSSRMRIEYGCIRWCGADTERRT